MESVGGFEDDCNIENESSPLHVGIDIGILKHRLLINSIQPARYLLHVTIKNILNNHYCSDHTNKVSGCLS